MRTERTEKAQAGSTPESRRALLLRDFRNAANKGDIETIDELLVRLFCAEHNNIVVVSIRPYICSIDQSIDCFGQSVGSQRCSNARPLTTAQATGVDVDMKLHESGLPTIAATTAAFSEKMLVCVVA